MGEPFTKNWIAPLAPTGLTLACSVTTSPYWPVAEDTDVVVGAEGTVTSRTKLHSASTAPPVASDVIWITIVSDPLGKLAVEIRKDLFAPRGSGPPARRNWSN